MTKKIDPGYRLLAAESVRREAKQLGRQSGGIRRAEDIEFIHRARVASRRLRAALRMFAECFPRKQFKQWRKETRRLTTELGAARDTDVRIGYLDQSLGGEEDDACRGVLAQLLSNARQDRGMLQQKVLDALDRFRQRQVLKQLKTVAKEMIATARMKRVEVKSPYVFSKSEKQIVSCLDNMLDCRHSLEDPAARADQHAMRIAAKRLRYSLEIVAPLYDGRLDEHIKAVRKLQTRLGNMRDCDVWLENLQTFSQFETGVERLLKRRQESREQMFRDVIEYWKKLDKARQWARQWDGLVGVLHNAQQPAVGMQC